MRISDWSSDVCSSDLGDFVTRRVAGRDLVLSRDSTGVMRCFLNACPHRGAKIVREKTGNARSFTCIYHAWQFNNAGKLIGLNGPETYAPDFKADPLHQLQPVRSEEHTSELQSLMRISYAVFCLNKKKNNN